MRGIERIASFLGYERKHAVSPQAELPLDPNSIVLVSGRSNPPLARGIADNLGLPLSESAKPFPDKEVDVQIPNNLRKRDVFIIQPTSGFKYDDQEGSPNDSLIELLLMIDAADRASADEITAVIPYFAYSRKDRKDKPRTPISASVIARMIKHAGARRIFTLDLHAEQTMGSVQGPWDNLYGSAPILPIIQKELPYNFDVVAPDVGATKRAEKIALLLKKESDIAAIYKRRTSPTNTKALGIMGNVEGEDLLIVDDMVGTGGSIVEGAKLLKDDGAKTITVAVAHGLFLGDALAKIQDSPIDCVYATDTVYQSEKVRNHPKIRIVSVAPLISTSILRIHTGDSLSALIPQAK